MVLTTLLAAGVLVAGQAPAPKANDKLVETLSALEKESWEMVRRRDVAGLRRYATDDFLWLFADGTRVRKGNVEAFVRGYELASYSMSEPEVVRFDAEAAVLVYRLTYAGAEQGKKPVTQTVWATSTYV